VSNKIGLALSMVTGLKSASEKALSTSANLMSGFASAAVWIGSSSRKPTPMIRLQFSATRLSMFGV